MSWQLPKPERFRGLCAELDARPGTRGEGLKQLAGYDLDSNGLHRLARSVTAALDADAAAPLARLTLGLVSNATTDLLIPPLIGAAARYGIALSVIAAPFGVTAQAAFDPASPVLAANPDVVLMALDYSALFGGDALEGDPEARVAAALADIADTAGAFGAAGRATIIVQTVAAPPERIFGSLDRRQSGTPAWLAARFNEGLCSEVVRPGIALLDVEGLAAAIGYGRWFDRAQWMTARLPFAQDLVPLYADHVGRLLGAIRGNSRKVLVLDLDNTLWGGVIGDDGVNGIRLGQGDPVGEAFLDLQRAALTLKRRGILLALCSKNTDAIARAAIREHPDMLLREDDFAAIQINWNDKASNIEAIAEQLSLGLDSFVFLDDNPVERDQVRSALPQVRVPELPRDPTDYARILLTGGFFESVAFSQEDRDRAEQYAANARRQTLLSRTRDMGEFLKSLEMSAIFVGEGDTGWQRFTQLVNKSNQFNLTTRRYTEAEILALAADASVLTLQVRLADRFGDNGLISAVICRPAGNAWEIDTWVMSCRVLNRQVEIAVLNEIVRRARAAGIIRLRGIYRPTERNKMVEAHYERLGFSPIETTDSEASFGLDVTDYEARTVPIAIDTKRPEPA
ncbi:MAG TPA: HAD-IIIC family phosphatase [Aliidongia sp.]|nr:HAD-IIIC family phosphatase [Aliidongia sp.]